MMYVCSDVLCSIGLFDRVNCIVIGVEGLQTFTAEKNYKKYITSEGHIIIMLCSHFGASVYITCHHTANMRTRET